MTLDPAQLQIVTHPHPTLRRTSKPVRRMDPNLHAVIERMFDLMYEARGVGLAANQVDIPLRLCVINPAGKRGEGEEIALINPVLDRPKGSFEGEEGCLSLPGMYGNVLRPKMVRLTAYDPQGQKVERFVEGYLARIVQHELDHLDGVLFFDRMKPDVAREFEDRLEELELEFRSKQKTGAMPADETLLERLKEWEQHYA